MANLMTREDGAIELPQATRERYRLTPNTPIRIIETRSGILIVPLTDEPMSAELAQELEEWQSLSAESWNMFPYEDKES